MIILWTDNFRLDSQKLDKAVEETIKLPDCLVGYEGEQFYHSTYYIPDIFKHPEIVFLEEYKSVIAKFMKSMGLYERTSFTFNHWMQVYQGNQSGHPVHEHFKFNTFFSWVHFIRPTKKKCFFFIDSEGNKKYPENQNPGDFVVFPSWAEHGVEPIDENGDEKRVVIAGNISVFTVKLCAGYIADFKHVSNATQVIETYNPEERIPGLDGTYS